MTWPEVSWGLRPRPGSQSPEGSWFCCRWECVGGCWLLFSSSVVSDSLRPHELQHARHPSPSPLLEFTQTHVHRVGDAIQPSHPLSSPSPSAFNLSQHQGCIRVFSNESALHIRRPKYWSFSLNISASNEHPGLISCRMEYSLIAKKKKKSLGTLGVSVAERSPEHDEPVGGLRVAGRGLLHGSSFYFFPITGTWGAQAFRPPNQHPPLSRAR